MTEPSVVSNLAFAFWFAAFEVLIVAPVVLAVRALLLWKAIA